MTYIKQFEGCDIGITMDSGAYFKGTLRIEHDICLDRFLIEIERNNNNGPKIYFDPSKVESISTGVDGSK